jgi:hypothetical protein
MKKLDFLEKARNIHGYKYKYINIPDKITLKDKIKIEFNGKIFIQTVSKHLMGKCPEKTINKKTTEDFILESKRIWGDKYDYSLTEYTSSLNNVKIIYNGIIYEQRASSHLKGMAPEFRKTEDSIIKKLINDIDSEGLDIIKKFLNKFNIEYTNKIDCSNLNFNFYIKDLRTCIDYRSRYHYEPIDKIGGLKIYEAIKNEDKLKEEYCEENFINLIKIKYDQIESIDQILWENLKEHIKQKNTNLDIL